MKTALSRVVLLTFAPLIAATSLVIHHPESWGGSVSFSAILGLWFFSMFTVWLWPTYITAVVATPWLMRRVAARRAFNSSPIVLLLSVAALPGAVLGVCVLTPIVVLTLRDSSELALSWVLAGAISGALTLIVICAIYRCVPESGEPFTGGNAR